MWKIILASYCLSGWIISSCLPRQYHYVAGPMNWTEAQTYCRKMYTDLATIESLEEMKQVNKTILLSGRNSEVWIGLYKKVWKWSDNYTQGNPGHWKVNETCTVLHFDWFYDTYCYNVYTFFCYRGSQQDPKYVHINERMDWFSAQRYCRENYIDLVTVKNYTEVKKIQSLLSAEIFSSWIGLYSDSRDFWSDGSSSKFRYWNNSAHHSITWRELWCGVANIQSSGEWSFQHCENELPFVCYSVPQLEIKRQLIKLRMKPGDSSLDLNNPAVKAGLLKKLQNRLKKSGLNGVTLKWREQPDGKVFHREKESSQKKNRKKTEL